MKPDPEQDDRNPRRTPRPEQNPPKPGRQGGTSERDTSRDPEEEGSAGRQPA
jgi:hypothetical protein